MSLIRLRGCMRATALALIAITTACAQLPAVKPRVAPDFAAGRTQVRKLAILPVDITVHDAGKPPRPHALDQRLMSDAVQELVQALRAKGYEVDALVRPDGLGVAPEGQELGFVIHPQDLTALRVQIHETTRLTQATGAAGTGAAVLQATVSAQLSRQLALTTGADGSLYVRAWAYLAPDDGGKTALKIAIGVLLATLIVGVIVLAVLTEGKALEGIGKFLAGTAKTAAKVAVVAGEVAVRTLAAMPVLPDIHLHVPCHSCVDTPPTPPPQPVASVARSPEPPLPWSANPDEVSATLPQALLEPPAEQPTRAAPPAAPQLELGPRGRMPNTSTASLAVTLVHNHTGQALWHAEQTMSVRLSAGGNIRDLVRHFLKALPPADHRPNS